MLHNPRNQLLAGLKIFHDYGLKFAPVTPIKVYYDIETGCFNSTGVPQVTDRNAFIVSVAMTIEVNGATLKRCLINNSMGYTWPNVERDIDVRAYHTES